MYKPRCVLVLNGVEDDYPLIGQVDSVFVVESRVLAEVNLMTISVIIMDIYIVERTTSHKIVIYTK